MPTRGTICYVQYTNPAAYPPLEHSSRILADAGWRVLFLGTGFQGADALEFPAHPNIEVRRWKFQRPGFRQKLHYLAFAVWTIWTALRLRPDWVYASDPLSCPAALAVSFLGFRVLYHEHDSPAGNGAISAFQRFVLFSRRMLARRANLCVLPNQRRIEVFRQETGRVSETVCVWNCPSRDEAAVVPVKPGNKFIAYYHGSVVPPRLPLTVIDALAQLPAEVELHVAGYETIGHPGYIAELEKAAERLGQSARFRYLGTSPRDQLLPEARAAHVGLALMPLSSDDLNMQAMTGASNKPFEYLACGLPLLVCDSPEWKDMFVTPGYGLSCDPSNPDSIADALRWYLDHPGEAEAARARGRQRILDEWNYEAQFSAVLVHLLGRVSGDANSSALPSINYSL